MHIPIDLNFDRFVVPFYFSHADVYAYKIVKKRNFVKCGRILCQYMDSRPCFVEIISAISRTCSYLLF